MAAPYIDEVARLVGDPSRATMLVTLMDGRAWTGSELARAAHVTPSTASEHLQRLVNGALLSVVPQGRNRYYRIASPDVAHALESLMSLATRTPTRSDVSGSIDLELRRARTCYDHLAGELGVALTEALIARGAITFGPSAGQLTAEGATIFGALEIELDRGNSRRVLCRPCLDWTERRFHLAGGMGVALARHAFNRGWLARKDKSRVVVVTECGVAALQDAFGIEWRH
jgi:DNA-binding transcriptional ArsR family regulator